MPSVSFRLAKSNLQAFSNALANGSGTNFFFSHDQIGGPYKIEFAKPDYDIIIGNSKYRRGSRLLISNEQIKGMRILGTAPPVPRYTGGSVPQYFRPTHADEWDYNRVRSSQNVKHHI